MPPLKAMWMLSSSSDSHTLMRCYWIFRHLWTPYDHVLYINLLFFFWSKKIIQLFSYFKANRKYRIITSQFAYIQQLWVYSIYPLDTMFIILVQCTCVCLLHAGQYTICLTAMTQLTLDHMSDDSESMLVIIISVSLGTNLVSCICYLTISKM